MKDLIGRLSQRTAIARPQVERTAALFDEGSTVPFVARYRKEVTGGLDEEQLAGLRRELDALRKLDDRQRAVLKSIQEQGQLTPELEAAIEEAETLQQVEDLYLPYKPKRRTRAQIARERGLEPLAHLILAQAKLSESKEATAEPYLSDDVPSIEDAWAGARDIVAEVVSDDARVRQVARQIPWDFGKLVTMLADQELDPKQVYEIYYEFSGTLKLLKPHQILAINRGEGESVLKVKIDVYDEEIIAAIRESYRPRKSPLAQDLRLAVADAYRRLIGPAIEREIRRDLTEQADAHAIGVFATNLRSLLLTPPLKDQTVLAIDPGFRTGSKVAVVDPTGKVLDTGTIYPHAPQNDWRASLDRLHEWVSACHVTLIAIGNGTASRETEDLVAQLIEERGRTYPDQELHYLIVNEAGASVYSASPLARAELPDLDVSIRGAVSIARRAQDPLAESVKIDPRSIGVGMYQHDVDQKALAETLSDVTMRVVNAVGVDVNTASPALLRYISGLGPKLAERIVALRDERGAFASRKALRDVKGMGAKTFEQAAGFLRIQDG
ncbi:MAG: RNA-binding transcriptional accessory protein, partial [Chloroflexi bacterium]|nr:RNA-binding transcriptional accessory protein [Chloroflexota bacterium]